jgi:hypothetical protein
MTAIASGDKMANYYPLIVKAVDALAADASSESRQALCDRMREALSAALRTTEPPFTEFQIMHEQLAFEDAVSRVEGEVAERERDSFASKFDGDDADDAGTTVEIPLMILTGGASGRFNRVWRYAWR